MTLEAPDIRPIEHDRGSERETPAAAPSDAEATGLHGGVDTIDDPTAGKTDGDLAERPVRNFKDLGTDAPGEPPIRPWEDFGTSKDDVNEIHPLKDHLLDEHSGPVVPFGETAETAGPGPARELGQRVMARAADAIRTKEAPAEPAAHGQLAPEMNAVPHRGDGDAHAPDAEHADTHAADTGDRSAERPADDSEVEGSAEEESKDQDDAAALAALTLPFFALGGSTTEAADDGTEPGPEDEGPEEEEPDAPDDGGDEEKPPQDDGGVRSRPDGEEPSHEEPGEGDEGGGDSDPSGGRGDGGGDDGDGPENGEPGDEEPDDEHKDDKDKDTPAEVDDDAQAESAGEDDDPRIPRQRALEERALAGDVEVREAERDTDTEKTPDTAVDEQAAIRARDEAHAANLDDLNHLAKIAAVHVKPGGNKNSRLHFELTHNGQDASEYLSELAADLRTGSTDIPRVSNWHEELTSPDQLKTGQIVEINSLRDLDEFMARVGGWLNNDIRATRGSGAVLPPPVGNWQEKGYRPSALVGNVKDLRGRHFNGSQVNIEAMALPGELRGHAPFTRYFTVSSQLKSTGKPPEPSRPMRLVSVSALPIGYTGNNVTARFVEIGRVPAAISAWLIDSRSREIGHDVEYENRQRPIMIAKRR